VTLAPLANLAARLVKFGQRALSRSAPAALAAAGVSFDDIARLHAQISLIPPSRDGIRRSQRRISP
jgi:hypothetical protein